MEFIIYRLEYIRITVGISFFGKKFIHAATNEVLSQVFLGSLWGRAGVGDYEKENTLKILLDPRKYHSKTIYFQITMNDYKAVVLDNRVKAIATTPILNRARIVYYEEYFFEILFRHVFC